MQFVLTAKKLIYVVDTVVLTLEQAVANGAASNDYMMTDINGKVWTLYARADSVTPGLLSASLDPLESNQQQIIWQAVVQRQLPMFQVVGEQADGTWQVRIL